MGYANTTEPTIERDAGRYKDGLYVQRSETVAGGMVNQFYDIYTALKALGRGSMVGPARYLYVTTDVAITVKVNAADAAAIAVSSTTPLTIPADVIAIYGVYLSSAGACGSGSATVKIFAA